MTTETDIALIAQRLELHIEQCTELGRENKETLARMHAENKAAIAQLIAAQAKMNSAFDQAKGGWKMIFFASGVIASIAAGIAWAINHITLRP